MHGCSACFGTCTESTTVDEPSEKQKWERSLQQGHSFTEKNYWTSSSNEMEGAKSLKSLQGSLSAVSTSSQAIGTLGSDSSTTDVPFLNHGLLLWNQQRRNWVGNRRRLRPRQPRDPVISWASTYENLLGTSHPFVQPIPLPGMVNFLVRVWEQEGLYD